jgi:hypothetical protein
VNSLGPAELPPAGAAPGRALGENAAGGARGGVVGVSKSPPELTGGGIGGTPLPITRGGGPPGVPKEPPSAGGGAPNDPLNGGGAPNDPPSGGGAPGGIMVGGGGAVGGSVGPGGWPKTGGPGGPIIGSAPRMMDGSPLSAGSGAGGNPPGDDVCGVLAEPKDGGGGGGAGNCGAFGAEALGLANPWNSGVNSPRTGASAGGGDAGGGAAPNGVTGDTGGAAAHGGGGAVLMGGAGGQDESGRGGGGAGGCGAAAVRGAVGMPWNSCVNSPGTGAVAAGGAWTGGIGWPDGAGCVG